MPRTTMLSFEHLFPDSFAFYHLGRVERSEVPTWELSLAGKVGFAFRIQGELQGLFLVFFDESLDASLYSEIGNTLASRIATTLSKNGSIVLISPPRRIGLESAKQLIKYSYNAWTQKVGSHHYCQYFHSHLGVRNTIETYLLTHSQESQSIGASTYA